MKIVVSGACTCCSPCAETVPISFEEDGDHVVIGIENWKGEAKIRRQDLIRILYALDVQDYSSKTG